MSTITPPEDDGTVTITRPGRVTEQRKIRVRYGGRALVVTLSLVAGVVCACWDFGPQHYEYAYIAALIGLITNGGTAIRYQRDLKWMTGYDRNK
jgi:hypothetical protein